MIRSRRGYVGAVHGFSGICPGDYLTLVQCYVFSRRVWGYSSFVKTTQNSAFVEKYALPRCLRPKCSHSKFWQLAPPRQKYKLPTYLAFGQVAMSTDVVFAWICISSSDFETALLEDKSWSNASAIGFRTIVRYDYVVLWYVGVYWSVVVKSYRACCGFMSGGEVGVGAG